jgi:hypothetical protein
VADAGLEIATAAATEVAAAEAHPAAAKAPLVGAVIEEVRASPAPPSALTISTTPGGAKP